MDISELFEIENEEKINDNNFESEFVVDCARQFSSICDCLLTFASVKYDRIFSKFLFEIKKNISLNLYLNDFYIYNDLKKLNNYKLKYQDSEIINELISELYTNFESYLILNNF